LPTKARNAIASVFNVGFLAFVISAGFFALGIYAVYIGDTVVGWTTIAIFGGLGVVGLLAKIALHIRGGRPLIPGRPGVVLRDGRDYQVAVTDEKIILTNKSTGEAKQLDWADLTEVHIVAIDAFPIGGISFILYRGMDVTEIPTNADGYKALLHAMQVRLAGFDNMALLEAMDMFDGHKTLWTKA
jgi:hypothetical protein